MLKLVDEALTELGLIQAGQPLRYCVNITTGEAISISAFVDGNIFFQVKSSEFVDLEPEYQAYQKASSRFPGFVPRPLGFVAKRGWRIMVSEGVRHAAFPVEALLKFDARRQTPATDLLRYFEIGCLNAALPTVAPHKALLDSLDEYFAGTRYAGLARRYVELAHLEGVHSLPVVAQHGDFVLNNLARSAGRLVIFDWEDYGKIALQGLDLATLTFSVLGNDTRLMLRLSEERGVLDVPVEAFLRRACACSGIDFTLFRRLIPLYLIVFLYMKRNYSPNIQQRIGTLLDQFFTIQAFDDAYTLRMGMAR